MLDLILGLAVGALCGLLASILYIRRLLAMDNLGDLIGELLDTVLTNIVTNKTMLEKLAIVGAAVGSGAKSAFGLGSGSRKPKLMDIITSLFMNKFGSKLGLGQQQEAESSNTPETPL
jgi:hypothetical protein